MQMGIIDSIKGQLIDIIEWTSQDPETLANRFERRNNEIKMGAKLVVREGQAVIFINEGTLSDVFTPGTYTLSTQNLPILADLKGWKYGFNSPFKAEVYFINRLTISNRKWGTPNPLMMRDKDLGVVRLRAFGAFAYAIEDAGKFFKASVGTLAQVQTHDLETQLKALIVSLFSDTLGEAQISAFDLAAKYTELGALVEKALVEKFGFYGLQVKQFVLENISLPPEVEALIDKRSGMGVIGNVDQYLKFNVADKVGEAISQGGGLAGTLAGAGLGLALGGGLAGQMTGAMGGNTAAPKPPSGPPPLPTDNVFVSIGGQQQGPFNLVQLKQLVTEQKIDRESLIWKDGMAAWATASSLPDIASIFSGVPPKLPS
jgi:membrane protease subunit (stomatin/prohibitin family)